MNKTLPKILLPIFLLVCGISIIGLSFTTLNKPSNQNPAGNNKEINTNIINNDEVATREYQVGEYTVTEYLPDDFEEYKSPEQVLSIVKSNDPQISENPQIAEGPESTVTIVSESDTLLYFVRAEVRDSDPSSTEIFKIEKNVTQPTNTITIDIPLNFTGNIEVTAMYDDGRIPEFRTWSNLIFSEATMTLDSSSPNLETSPSIETANRIPLIIAIDQQVDFLVGKGSKAIMLRTVKKDGTEIIIDDTTQYPFTTFFSQNQKVYFGFDLSFYDPSFTIDKAAYYELTLQHQNGNIETLTYEQDVTGVYVKMPEVDDVTQGYVFHEEYPGSWFGTYGGDLDKTGSLYFVNWYSFSRLRTRESLYRAFPTVFREISITLTPRNRGYVADSWDGDILLGEVNMYGSSRSLHNNYIYVPNSEDIVPEIILDEMVTYLSTRYSIPYDSIYLDSIEQVTWTDSCMTNTLNGESSPQSKEILGIVTPSCAQEIIEGYRLIFKAEGDNFEFSAEIHSNEDFSIWRVHEATILSYQEIITYLSNEYNIPEEYITLSSYESVWWRDGCLELGEPGERCITGIIPGYLLTFTSNYLGEERTFTIHSNTSLSIWREKKSTNPYQEMISYLSNEYNIPEENIVLESRQHVNWRDGCLELGEPGERCTTVVTPGYLLTFTSNYLGEERTFTIHSNESLSIWKENKSGELNPKTPIEVM